MTLIIILLILWAFGFFGHGHIAAIPDTHGFIHVLLIVALLLWIIPQLRGRP